MKYKETSLRCFTKTRSTDLYFSDIRQYPELTREEEKRLLIRAKDGDMSARDVIVQSQLKFVVSLAKHIKTEVPFDDVVAEGNFGLLDAIDNYDINMDVRFSSYAVHWIKKHINQFIANNSSTVRLKKSNKITKCVKDFSKSFFLENGRYPCDDEIREMMREAGVNVTENQPLRCESIPILVDLDNGKDRVEEDESIAFNSLTAVNNVEEYIGRCDDRLAVERFFKWCTDDEADTIKKLYGIGCIEMGPATISKMKGISESCVRNTVKKVVHRIEKSKKKKK